jgi:hypothetical protein
MDVMQSAKGAYLDVEVQAQARQLLQRSRLQHLLLHGLWLRVHLPLLLPPARPREGLRGRSAGGEALQGRRDRQQRRSSWRAELAAGLLRSPCLRAARGGLRTAIARPGWPAGAALQQVKRVEHRRRQEAGYGAARRVRASAGCGLSSRPQ